MELDHLRALKALRARREERAAGLRARWVRECEQLRKQFDQASCAAEQLKQDLGGEQIGRWGTLFSTAFDHCAIARTCQQDAMDEEALRQAAHHVTDIQDRINKANDQLIQATAEHAASVRRLEAGSQLLDIQYRAQADRQQRRSEAAQDDMSGARHVG